MKLFLLLLLTCYIYGSFGSLIEGFAPVKDKKAKANGYTCQMDDVLLKPGKHINIEGDCNEYHCGKDGAIFGATCGTMRLDKGCKLVFPPVKPYPECCEDIEC